MDVSLARDAAGNAFPLPEQATFWRVRRHTGGRPSAVVGPTGEQLFIPIAADVDSLLSAGCAPGGYRLEAVDLQHRPVGAPIAFVEIVETQTAPVEHADLLRTAVEALTRTTEAMQRTQLERERASAARERELMNAQVEAQRALIESQRSQMQLVVSLFERVTGAGDPVSLIKQHTSIQRAIDRQRNADEEAYQPSPQNDVPWWVSVVSQIAPAVGMWAAGKSPQEIAATLAQQAGAGLSIPVAQAAATVPGAPAPAAAVTAEPTPAPPTVPAEPTPNEKMQQALNTMSEAERTAIKKAIERLSDDVFERMMRYVAGLSVAETVAWVRSNFVEATTPSPTNGQVLG